MGDVFCHFMRNFKHFLRKWGTNLTILGIFDRIDGKKGAFLYSETIDTLENELLAQLKSGNYSAATAIYKRISALRTRLDRLQGTVNDSIAKQIYKDLFAAVAKSVRIVETQTKPLEDIEDVQKEKLLYGSEKIFIYRSFTNHKIYVVPATKADKIFKTATSKLRKEITESSWATNKHKAHFEKTYVDAKESFFSKLYKGHKSYLINEKLYFQLKDGADKLPPQEVLTEFHICGRKLLYIFKEETRELVDKEPGLQCYPCIFCSGFHVGHSSEDAEKLNKREAHLYEDRFARTWVKYPEKAEAFLREKGLA